MSRVIDPEKIQSGDLDEADMLYLAQRDQLPRELLEKLREDLDDDDEDPEELIRRALAIKQRRSLKDQPHTGDVNTKGTTLAQTRRGAEKADDGLNRPEDYEEPEDEDEEAEEVDYEAMTNEELRVELARRELSVNGNKAELILRLEENDAESEEEEEEV